LLASEREKKRERERKSGEEGNLISAISKTKELKKDIQSIHFVRQQQLYTYIFVCERWPSLFLK
jgi:hypothetical protein